jgi:hypothetical protein
MSDEKPKKTIKSKKVGGKVCVFKIKQLILHAV